MTTFSVIIPTRNRAALLQVALQSVLSQVDAEFEVVVVNDGTSGEELAAIDRVTTTYAGAASFIHLPQTATGHGVHIVLNTGTTHSRGDYFCFLDDDDCWTDPGHLAHAARIVQQDASPVDAMFFDQAAFRGDMRAPGPIWLEDLGARLVAARGDAGPAQAYAVDPALLLSARGFAHTNTMIVRRDVFERTGGFDTGLRYEGDRDFFLRLIDGAAQLRYAPTVCSRHNIPAKASLSTTTSTLDKALDQLRLLHKAVRHARNPAIAAYARRHRRFALRKAVEAAAQNPRLMLKLARFLPYLLTAPGPTETVVTVPIHDEMVAAGRQLPARVSP